MAKINADIKSNGAQQKDLVDLFYMIVTSIRGIAAKLDADAGVTDADFLATVDAVLNVVIDDSKGNYLNLAKAETSSLVPTVMVSPVGFDQARSGDLLYMIYRAWHLMCAKLDVDGNPPTHTNYDASFYTATFLHGVENSKGAWAGSKENAYLRGGLDLNFVVDILYEIVSSIDLFCQQADTDAAPADTNYEALWYTNNITLTVEDSAGNRIGN